MKRYGITLHNIRNRKAKKTYEALCQFNLVDSYFYSSLAKIVFYFYFVSLSFSVNIGSTMHLRCLHETKFLRVCNDMRVSN